MGHKTSVYMDDELFSRWKKSGRTLTALIEAGLNDFTPQEIVTAVNHAADPDALSLAHLHASVAGLVHRADALTELLTGQGYVIVQADELRAMIGGAVAGVMDSERTR